MDAKQILILGGVGALGFLVYRQFFMPQQGNLSVSPYSYPNNAFGSAVVGGQPSEQYPYTAIQAPRVDNTSQPWTATSANAVSNPAGNLNMSQDLLNFNETVKYVQGGADIVNSLSSIWNDIGSWWSDDNSAFSTDWF